LSSEILGVLWVDAGPVGGQGLNPRRGEKQPGEGKGRVAGKRSGGEGKTLMVEKKKNYSVDNLRKG